MINKILDVEEAARFVKKTAMPVRSWQIFDAAETWETSVIHGPSTKCSKDE